MRTSEHHAPPARPKYQPPGRKMRGLWMDPPGGDGCSAAIRWLWLGVAALVVLVLLVAPLGLTGVAWGRGETARPGLAGPATVGPSVSVVETSGVPDPACASGGTPQRCLLATLPTVLKFTSGSASAPTTITVDGTQSYQPMAGFGATLNDADAYVLCGEPTGSALCAPNTHVLDELFASPPEGIGLDYVRIPIGGNDFSQKDYSKCCSASNNYTEDDTPGDTSLTHFSIAHDQLYLIPVLQHIHKYYPNVKFLASPWTPPAWMKCSEVPVLGCVGSGQLDGGGLLKGYESLYASYLAKFVATYAGKNPHAPVSPAIPIAAITVQNEPMNSTSAYPSMSMTWQQEATIAGYLAQDLHTASLSTQLLGLDHNWDLWHSYALPLLQNQPAVAGTAFHCYHTSKGDFSDPSQQGDLEAQEPTKPIYEDECTPLGGYTFAQNLVNNTFTEGIEGTQDWSRTVMFWNLALNSHDGPTINSNCASTAPHPCLPIVQVANGSATPQVGYYTLGQFSQFVQQGADRICSYTTPSSVSAHCPPASGVWPVDTTCPLPPTPVPLQSVAFRNPNGQIVLVVLNKCSTTQTFAVDWDGESFTETILASSVQTFAWQGATATWSIQSTPNSPGAAVSDLLGVS
jgi:glucosylceramidase